MKTFIMILKKEKTKMNDWIILSGLSENTNNDELSGFAEKRGKGADKIANDAKEKGGLALLTYHHFKVKLPYYDKASNGKLSFEELKKEYEETCSELHSHMETIEKMDQIKFQELVGRLEVLGELLIKQKEK